MMPHRQPGNPIFTPAEQGALLRFLECHVGYEEGHPFPQWHLLQIVMEKLKQPEAWLLDEPCAICNEGKSTHKIDSSRVRRRSGKNKHTYYPISYCYDKEDAVKIESRRDKP